MVWNWTCRWLSEQNDLLHSWTSGSATRSEALGERLRHQPAIQDSSMTNANKGVAAAGKECDLGVLLAARLAFGGDNRMRRGGIAAPSNE